MKIQELDYKIIHIEVLVKENTNTMTKGFNQLFMLINELLQDHTKQPYCSELDEAKSQEMGNQSSVDYNLLEFLESFIDHPLTHEKPPKFNQPLSMIFHTLRHKNLLQPREPKPMPNPLPPHINLNLYYHFY